MRFFPPLRHAQPGGEAAAISGSVLSLDADSAAAGLRAGSSSDLDGGARERVDLGRRRFVYMLPAGAFAAIAAGFAVSLERDPSRVPSALIGKPVPEFALPPVQGRTLGLSGADLIGEVSLVNVFAIDWGVYGVPETFVIDRDGIIAHKYIGPVTEQALEETFLPLVARLRV